MLSLTEDALHLQCRATNKNEAIHIAASALEKQVMLNPALNKECYREKKVSQPILEQVLRFPIAQRKTLIWSSNLAFRYFNFLMA